MSEDNPMPISDAQLEAMAIEQRNAILNDTTDIVATDNEVEEFLYWYAGHLGLLDDDE